MKSKYLFALCLTLIAILVGGCVTNDQVDSERQWQQQNPYYKPTSPPDPRPQWGVFSEPER